MPVGRAVLLFCAVAAGPAIVVAVFLLVEDFAGDVSAGVALAGAVVVAGCSAIGRDVARIAVDGVALVAAVFGFGGVVIVLPVVVLAGYEDVFFGGFAAGGP